MRGYSERGQDGWSLERVKQPVSRRVAARGPGAPATRSKGGLRSQNPASQCSFFPSNRPHHRLRKS
jgi:hypothetical protein